ncbi:glycerol-3-phosphate dehydrogenase [Candidatus Phytoplasma ziziphi]|uniref:Glycerol-3-phosphate dehydrogenase [NAD(P)+] n=1 Tax=Ziziphus jujuba witches'-broom phytoplasma TaxID=135727 RepID=A0A660HLP7_ZIZJU|nr:NAD(P)H-dependent glycerol-3-phosphate dehydrogenase [Candidatus Phytoplasma ziziphi]AYJ00980.1 glycerol-3-phosphate dehydrogenase [Candidatus Phytoplasma ziziphi]
MEKITIIGGGAWGATLAQVLDDNSNKVLIYDNNIEYIKKINEQKHPFFDVRLSDQIKATNDLEKALFHSDYIFLSVPAQNMRNLFKKINNILISSKNFINVSKGIEFQSNKIISQIITEEISADKIKNYVFLAGPSHAEEVILRKITFLTASSLNQEFALKIAKIFFNKNYLKVSVSNDVIGSEICASFKNALAFVSGMLDGVNFASNARSAFITFGIAEMKKILFLFSKSNSIETVLSLTGLGDLTVTVFNENSRNYQAGKKIQMGKNLDQILNQATQVIEGIYNLKVFYNLAIKNKICLPIIESAYKVIFEHKPVDFILLNIFEKC